MPNWNVGIEPHRTAGITSQVTGTNASVLLIATSTVPSSTGCICVKADSANTGAVYVGFISNISSTDGFILYGRDQVSLDWDKAAAPLYGYFAGTAQKVYVIGTL